MERQAHTIHEQWKVVSWKGHDAATLQVSSTVDWRGEELGIRVDQEGLGTVKNGMNGDLVCEFKGLGGSMSC
jgi:hypothetical protein